MTAPGRHSLAGLSCLILTLAGWSSVPLFLRHFAESIDPWTSNGWRYGVSALLWAPLLAVAMRRRRMPAGIWRAAVVPAAVNAAGQVAFCVAHYCIDPGLLAFGLRSSVIFAAVGAYLLFAPERTVIRSSVYLAGLLGVLAGTSGAVLAGRDPLGGAAARGVLLAVGSGALFAAYALAVRRYMSGYNSVLAFAVICQYTAGAMVVLMLWLGRDRGAEGLRLPADQIILLLASALIGIALGHVLYYASIARLGVAVSTGVLQLHPFVVALASAALFGEALTPAQWAFGAVAFCGAAAMLAVRRRLRPGPEAAAPSGLAPGGVTAASAE